MQDPEDILLALKDLVGKTYLFKIGIERLTLRERIFSTRMALTSS